MCHDVREKFKSFSSCKKVLPPAVKGETDITKPFELVNSNLKLQSREDVRSLLPDILGKVLARVWLDSNFHKEFLARSTENIGRKWCFLPENMSIEFQKQNTDRPRIVVFEQKARLRFKLRVFYLQLVMMAGR